MRLARQLLAACLGPLPLLSGAADTAGAPDFLELDLAELQQVPVQIATRTQRSLLEAPGIVSVIEREAILASGARSLADLLKRLPGVQVLQDFAGHRQVWIRGMVNAENERILLLIDGVPHREAASANWTPDEHLDIQNVERIELSRGPGSALYGGNAYAGTIAVHTRRGSAPWRLKAAAGSRDYRQLGLSGGHGFSGGAVHVAASALDTDGWRSERGRNGGPSDNTTARSAQTLQLRLDLDNGLSADLSAGNLDYRYPLHPVGTRRDTYYRYALAALKYRKDWGDWDLSARLSADDTRFGFDSIARNADGSPRQLKEQKKTSLVYGFEAQVDWQQSADLSWVFGVNADENRAGRLEEEWNPGSSDPARRYFINSWLSQHGEGPGENEASTANRGVYAQNEARFADDTLILTTGLRWDEFDAFGGQLSPRLALVYMPSAHTALKLLAGEAFRPPTIRQLYVRRSDGKQPGNPDLMPELVRTYELEWLQQVGEGLQLRADLFSNRFEDMTVTIAEGQWQSSPIPRRIDGLEVELKGSLRLADWTLSGYVNHTNLFHAYDHTPLGRLAVPYLARRLANLGFSAEYGEFQFSTAWNWVGRRNGGLSYDPGSGRLVDTYHSDPGFAAYPEYRARDNKGGYLTQDLNLRWRHEPYTAELVVYNLWNREHYDPTYDPDIYYDVTREPRTLMLRLSMRF